MFHTSAGTVVHVLGQQHPIPQMLRLATSLHIQHHALILRMRNIDNIDGQQSRRADRSMFDQYTIRE